MANERHSEDEEEQGPETPPIPDLPPAPRLKPDLPPLKARDAAEETQEYRQMGLAYSIPLSLVTPIVVLTLAGAWIDSYFHKSPAFTLGGALVGVVVGFLTMIRMVMRLNKD